MRSLDAVSIKSMSKNSMRFVIKTKLEMSGKYMMQNNVISRHG